MVNLPAPPYSNETSATSATGMWKPGAGNGRNVTGITIHHWGNTPWLDFDGIVNFLCSYRPSAPTSAHYVAQGVDAHNQPAPRVACIVDPDDIAYACGTWSANLSQISIECRPDCTPADREVVAQLIARLRNQYGYLPLVGHQHWVPDDCPGSNWMASLGWLDARANQILAAAAAPAAAPPAPAPTPTPTRTTPPTKGRTMSHIEIVGGSPWREIPIPDDGHTYAVSLCFGDGPQTAGVEFLAFKRMPSVTTPAAVSRSGSWDAWQRDVPGRITLQPGEGAISVRFTGTTDQTLSVELYPVS